ncbi:MAG: hypothetical protein ACI9QL_001701 [Candidatus Omnitrophota bacterium]|jgi:hypothetical protein
MDYKAKQDKHRKDAFICVGLVLLIALGYAGFVLLTQPQVAWAETDYKIPDFRNAEAQHLGRQYEITLQEHLTKLMQETLEEGYTKNKVLSPNGLVFSAAFEETFKKQLKITVTKRKTSGEDVKSWDILLTHDEDLDARIIEFTNSFLK